LSSGVGCRVLIGEFLSRGAGEWRRIALPGDLLFCLET